MKYSDSLQGGANINLGFPLDDFLGTRRGSASPIGTASAMPSSGTHRWIVLAVLIIVGYGLWHYSQTH